ncbi:hypothetical protein P3T37_006605 [Kitasatospora sp. MAA4]|nr:hypothetical protein [Kitasatospora sp. MAA4]
MFFGSPSTAGPLEVAVTGTGELLALLTGDGALRLMIKEIGR